MEAEEKDRKREKEGGERDGGNESKEFFSFLGQTTGAHNMHPAML